MTTKPSLGFNFLAQASTTVEGVYTTTARKAKNGARVFRTKTVEAWNSNAAVKARQTAKNGAKVLSNRTVEAWNSKPIMDARQTAKDGAKAVGEKAQTLALTIRQKTEDVLKSDSMEAIRNGVEILKESLPELPVVSFPDLPVVSLPDLPVVSLPDIPGVRIVSKKMVEGTTQVLEMVQNVIYSSPQAPKEEPLSSIVTLISEGESYDSSQSSPNVSASTTSPSLDKDVFKNISSPSPSSKTKKEKQLEKELIRKQKPLSPQSSLDEIYSEFLISDDEDLIETNPPLPEATPPPKSRKLPRKIAEPDESVSVIIPRRASPKRHSATIIYPGIPKPEAGKKLKHVSISKIAPKKEKMRSFETVDPEVVDSLAEMPKLMTLLDPTVFGFQTLKWNALTNRFSTDLQKQNLDTDAHNEIVRNQIAYQRAECYKSNRAKVIGYIPGVALFYNLGLLVSEIVNRISGNKTDETGSKKNTVQRFLRGVMESLGLGPLLALVDLYIWKKVDKAYKADYEKHFRKDPPGLFEALSD